MGRDAFAEGRCAGRWAWFARRHLADHFEMAPAIRLVDPSLEDQRLVQKLVRAASDCKEPPPGLPLAEVERVILEMVVEGLADGAKSEFLRGMTLLTNGRAESGRVQIGRWRRGKELPSTLDAVDTLAVMLLLSRNQRLRAEEQAAADAAAQEQRDRDERAANKRAAKQKKAKQQNGAAPRGKRSPKITGKNKKKPGARKPPKPAPRSIQCPLCMKQVGPYNVLRAHVLREHPHLEGSMSKTTDHDLVAWLQGVAERAWKIHAAKARGTCPRCGRSILQSLLEKHLLEAHGPASTKSLTIFPAPPPDYLQNHPRGPAGFGEY